MHLLDANVFIDAKRNHYRFELCPGFWDWLDHARDRGVVASIEKVKGELVDAADELSDWAKARPEFFLEPDDDVVTSMSALTTWTYAQNFTSAARDEFLAAADYYLVAHAHAHGHVVVTHERPAPEARRKIKIPDACNALGVAWMSPFDMLIAEGAEFVLPGTP